jgi:hypothetical protein
MEKDGIATANQKRGSLEMSIVGWSNERKRKDQKRKTSAKYKRAKENIYMSKNQEASKRNIHHWRVKRGKTYHHECNYGF